MNDHSTRYILLFYSHVMLDYVNFADSPLSSLTVFVPQMDSVAVVAVVGVA